MNRIYAIISLWLLALSAAGADLQFRRYTTDNGLPSNCVRDCAQAPDGYIWLTTDAGLIRFDGYNFVNYPLESAPDEAVDNFALSLCFHQGDFWVGSDSHIYRYQKDTNKFVPYTFKCSGAQISQIEAHRITFDEKGNMWVASGQKGVYRIAPNGEAKLFGFDSFNHYVSMVLVDSRGDVWAISNQGPEVMRLDRATDTFQPFHPETLQSSALAIAEDENHNLWLGTWDDGVVCFSPHTGQVIWRTSATDNHYFRHIHSLTFMPDGRLYVGSDAGLAIVEVATGKIRHYTNDVVDPYSLSDTFVYPITIDREGGVWIGTYYGGVNYLAPDLKQFQRFEPAGFGNSIGCSIISDIKEDSSGNIWMASDDGGLRRYSPAIGIFSQINLPGDAASHHNLHALCLDGYDLWIGSYASGVYVYDINTGRCRHYKSSDSDVNSLMTHSSYAIFRDKLSNVWVATGSWVNLYQRGTDNFRRVKDLKAQIFDIKEDVDGTLWFATQGAGIWRFNPQKGQWTNYSNSPGDKRLAHNHVNSICTTSKGAVYAATAQGLCQYSRTADVFEDMQLGLPTVSVSSVVDDGDDLWFTTDMGLVKFNPEHGCSVFTKSDGLSSSSFMPNSMLRTLAGKIYVGTRFGVTAFYPYQIKSNPVAPMVSFTELEIPNEKNHDSGDHLPNDINYIDKVVLHPEDYTFSVSFSALSFTNPEKNQYAYRLEGFDNDWINIGSSNKATYTNLPPGHYVLRVKASNSDNVWSADSAALNIEVQAPWYKTRVMQVIYALLFIGILYMIVREVMRRKERKHKVEIRRISTDKEIEVYQAKLSFFTMIAHEIRTPVSLIMGPLEKIMRSPEKVSPAMSRDLSVIERNSQRLLSLVNQLLDFKKVEEAAPTLNFTTIEVKPVVMAVADRFRPSMEQKSIILDVKYDLPDNFTADIDAEGVTKLLSNLLNNALKFTKNRVTLTVTRGHTDAQFVIMVSDNGIGISKKDQAKIFRPFYQVTDASHSQGGTGLGLSIVQSVTQGHGGEIHVDSAIDYGTTFVVTLPVHQANVSAEGAVTKVATDEAVQQPGEAAKTDSGKKQRLLVVDDNDELCTFIANNFDSRFEVITARDGVEALEILRTQNIQFVISDWMMPRLNGVELCQALRADANISHIPFILLTAKTDNASRIEGFNIGADAYVDKPFSLKVLEARIDNLLNMRALLRKKFSETPLEPLESVATSITDNAILTQLTALIEENFSNPDLNVDFLADKLDISRSGLYNKIKTLVDATPNDLIRITRLKHAAKLLVQGDYRINEVCYMVGFSSASYFAKCFQKQFGMTPTEFLASKGGMH